MFFTHYQTNAATPFSPTWPTAEPTPTSLFPSRKFPHLRSSELLWAVLIVLGLWAPFPKFWPKFHRIEKVESRETGSQCIWMDLGNTISIYLSCVQTNQSSIKIRMLKNWRPNMKKYNINIFKHPQSICGRVLHFNQCTTGVPSERMAVGSSSGCPRSKQTCRVKQSRPLWDFRGSKPPKIRDYMVMPSWKWQRCNTYLFKHGG